jgi:hypothetical protein
MTCVHERIAGITGSVLIGVIGLFVVITCAATPARARRPG